jgi:hypothetical protein
METLPTIRIRSQRSRPSLTSSAPGHAWATGGTFTAHRAGSHHGSTSAKRRGSTRPTDLSFELFVCRDFSTSCARLAPPFAPRCTTHNREVGGSNPPGAMAVPLRNAVSGRRRKLLCRDQVCRAVGNRPPSAWQSEIAPGNAHPIALRASTSRPQPAPTRGEARRQQTIRRRGLSLVVESERLAAT